jgi:hypothetical protein
MRALDLRIRIYCSWNAGTTSLYCVLHFQLWISQKPTWNDQLPYLLGKLGIELLSRVMNTC